MDAQVQKEKIAWGAGARKGNIMHKYTQNQSYVGSTRQTLTTNVCMTLYNWQICHQTHVLCGCTTFVPDQIRYQITFPPHVHPPPRDGGSPPGGGGGELYTTPDQPILV